MLTSGMQTVVKIKKNLKVSVTESEKYVTVKLMTKQATPNVQNKIKIFTSSVSSLHRMSYDILHLVMMVYAGSRLVTDNIWTQESIDIYRTIIFQIKVFF